LERRVRDPEKIASIVVDMLKSQPVVDAAYDRALGWMLDSEWDTTVPFDAPGKSETFELLGNVLSKGQVSPSESALEPA
jgi:hypothetical protein